jgi:SAM-dependent methyltransferase
VINLSADKPRVVAEAARVLRPGGRFAVSDVIADEHMDDATRADMTAWTGCIAGALTRPEFERVLSDAGFADVEIRETHRVHEHAASAIIQARKPAIPACALGEDELDAQLARYRRLSPHVAGIEREADRVVVRFDPDVRVRLLQRTLRIERECCPFFDLVYESGARRLTISVEDMAHAPRLEALVHALSPTA